MLSEPLKKEHEKQEEKAYKIIILALLGLVIALALVNGWFTGRETSRYYNDNVYRLEN